MRFGLLQSLGALMRFGLLQSLQSVSTLPLNGLLVTSPYLVALSCLLVTRYELVVTYFQNNFPLPFFSQYILPLFFASLL
jgi:hypothetical protein